MTRVQTIRTPAGRQIEVSHVLEASPDAAWALLTETTAWPTWAPRISAVESTDQRIQTGTTGRVRVAGAWVSFRVTDCADRHWTWQITGFPGATHQVEALGENRCRISFELPLYAMGLVPSCLRALESLETVLIEEQTPERV